jgi:hypothetical protein
MKKRRCYFLLLLLLSPAVSQQQQPLPNGTISGLVFKRNGEPARNLRLTARPSFLMGGHSGDFPHARTNNLGEYRFQKLPLWGKYFIFADDEIAGYSQASTERLDSHAEVEITPEHPESEFNLYLPPRAGFIQIHLTNRTTRAVIRRMMTVWVSPMDSPNSGLFTISCYSDHVILIPPDQNLLLHVRADGFSEWDESVQTGKPINVSSGGRLIMNVQLDPE